MPDSRAEAKGLGSAQRGKRPVRGRRHLVVNSQVSDKAARRANARAASSKRHFRMPFFLTRANVLTLSAGGASGSELIASGRASSGFAGRASFAANERGRSNRQVFQDSGKYFLEMPPRRPYP